MGAVNDRSIQLESLERDATVNRNLLEAMLLRAKQSTGAETILQANAKLVSLAPTPFTLPPRQSLPTATLDPAASASCSIANSSPPARKVF